ncbi:hypothetical protein [Amycolatopsis regifaucium]|uniref:hypothetical protein n=1 Tax=Amycolatopsis regifaucium TaxID=546365 RepID=UPI0011607171|nr:hypothetical protein [Amycolatopsis regifaucium]
MRARSDRLRAQALVRLGGHRVLMNGGEQILSLARVDTQRTGAVTLHCAVGSVRTMHAILRCEWRANLGDRSLFSVPIRLRPDERPA